MSLQEAQKMRMMVQFAGIEDTERNTAQIIIDGSQALVNGRLFDGYAGEGRWLQVDLSSSDPRTQPFRALASGPNDASFALFTLYGATRILSVADDVMDGLPVRRYTVNIQLDAALDQLPDQFVDGYESNLIELGRAQVEPQYTAEVWISEASGLIHHIEYVQELGPNMGGGSMSTTVDLIDFGVPLDLDYPEPEFITRLEDIKTPIDPLPRA